MTATIDPIDPSIPWSAEAAAGYALSCVGHSTPFLALWIDEQGTIRWSKANLSFQNQSEIASIVQAMSICWALGILDQS